MPTEIIKPNIAPDIFASLADELTEAKRIAETVLDGVAKAIKLAGKIGQSISDLRERVLPNQRAWIDDQLRKAGFTDEDIARCVAANNKLKSGTLDLNIRAFQLAGIAPVNEVETPKAATMSDWLKHAGKLTAIVERLNKPQLRELREFHLKEADRIAKLV